MKPDEKLAILRENLSTELARPGGSSEQITLLVDEINQIEHGPKNPQVAEHFGEYSQRLNAESERIRRHYSMHHGEAGRSREEEVRAFFALHLPSALDVKEGFVVDCNGGVSKQSDLLVIDGLWNKPIGTGASPFWLRESVYASIEIKTNLDRRDIDDAIEKCRAFKNLQPNWYNCGKVPINKDMLFGVWAFESPSVQTSIDNMAEALLGVPTVLQPDFLVVPGKLFAYMGLLQIMLHAGGSIYVQKRGEWNNSAQVNLQDCPKVQAFTSGHHAITMLLFFLTSWISQAGPRSANIMNYMNGVDFGTSLWSTQMHPS
jgi:hypothetical protein